MARLTILIALIALMLFAADSSARRQQEEEQSRCERELEGVNLGPCEQHIMQRIQREDQDEDDDQENVLKMRWIRNHHHLHYKRNPFLRRDNQRKCCNEIRDLEDNPQCMCEALQQIMENQSEELQGRRQIQRLEKELWNLPQSCGMRAPRGCDLSIQKDQESE